MTKKVIRRTINILIVDDDIDVCNFLKRILVKRNYSVEILTDPQNAIEIVKKQDFQIIILDIVMPKKDGIEVLKEIRKFDNKVCIIMLSAFPTVERAFESIREKVFEFITKPFDTKQFFEVISRAEKEFGLVTNLYQLVTNQIASRLKTLRNERKISLRQLANMAGISQSLIYQIEHAETAPSLATLTKLTSALQTDLSYFFEDL
ncbi:MAG: response regulator [Calditrichaeota bacterium]|nr:MAG: response regulator [Calditrichota bacterium]